MHAVLWVELCVVLPCFLVNFIMDVLHGASIYEVLWVLLWILLLFLAVGFIADGPYFAGVPMLCFLIVAPLVRRYLRKRRIRQRTDTSRSQLQPLPVRQDHVGLGAHEYHLSLIRSLPTFAFQRRTEDSDTESGGGGGWLQCAICLNMVQVGEMVRQLTACNHLFHVECIDVWLESHPTCPLCRSFFRSPLPPSC